MNLTVRISWMTTFHRVICVARLIIGSKLVVPTLIFKNGGVFSVKLFDKFNGFVN
jgi:hypothetical protein